jgi:hypothetical protein
MDPHRQQQLDGADRRKEDVQTPESTDWKRWHLGKAYKAFCIVSTSSPATNFKPPTQQAGLWTLTYPGCPPGDY